MRHLIHGSEAITEEAEDRIKEPENGKGGCEMLSCALTTALKNSEHLGLLEKTEPKHSIMDGGLVVANL